MAIWTKLKGDNQIGNQNESKRKIKVIYEVDEFEERDEGIVHHLVSEIKNIRGTFDRDYELFEYEFEVIETKENPPKGNSADS